MTIHRRENIHATLLVLSEKGVLLRGDSGSGKSTLASILVDQYKKLGRFACLVADDRVVITCWGDQLIGTCPATIEGYMEVYGAGITAQKTMSCCVVDFCFDLCDPQKICRMPKAGLTEILGVACPHIYLPAKLPLEAYNIVKNCVDGNIVLDT